MRPPALLLIEKAPETADYAAVLPHLFLLNSVRLAPRGTLLARQDLLDVLVGLGTTIFAVLVTQSKILSLHESRIDASLILEEGFVRALFHELAFRENYYLVCFPDGRQPVSDHDCCPALRDFVERCLDDLLAADINSRSGLVQDQDLRLFDDASRDGQSLALAS